MVPAGCEALTNPVGTAPGLLCQGEGFILAALPGVPHEMKELMEMYIFPRIENDERIKITGAADPVDDWHWRVYVARETGSYERFSETGTKTGILAWNWRGSIAHYGHC